MCLPSRLSENLQFAPESSVRGMGAVQSVGFWENSSNIIIVVQQSLVAKSRSPVSEGELSSVLASRSECFDIIVWLQWCSQRRAAAVEAPPQTPGRLRRKNVPVATPA